MARSVPADHPLAKLFQRLTERTFAEYLGWPDGEVIGYLAGVLVDFTHIDNLYRIRNARGHRVEEVAEMLAEGEVLLNAASFDREREVHKHIGDYTLFMAGVFPEYLRRLRTTRVMVSPDALLDYVQVGKTSYRIVSEFGSGEHRKIAPFFRKLSDRFELCVYGLGHVRAELDRLRDPRFRAIRGVLLS